MPDPAPTQGGGGPLVTTEPKREFNSCEQEFTPENLEIARKTLTKYQAMDWVFNGEGVRCPNFAVDDVEWLFGYIDHLAGEAP